MRFTEHVHKGRTVVAAGGEELGTVAALTLDDETWRVETLQVKLESDSADRLGAFWNLFHAGRIELPTRFVQSVSDTVVLSVSVDGLRQELSAESASASAP